MGADWEGSRRSEVWSDDFEVLHWVVERFEGSGHRIEVGEVLRVFPEEQYDYVRDSLRRMSSHTYPVTVNSSSPSRGALYGSPVPADVTERALPLAGGLPDHADTIADRMLAVLAEGAVNDPDPDRRFKLEAGLRGVGGMTRDVLVDVVAAAIARSTTPAHEIGSTRDSVLMNGGHR